MKRNAIARMILYSILALTLTGILVAGMGANGFVFHWSVGGSGTTVEGEVPIDAKLVKNIEIDWAAGSVEIQVADIDHITICEVMPEGCKYQMVYDLDNDTLSISYANATIGFGFGNWDIPSKDLVITVPYAWFCEKLEIDGAALTINLQSVYVGTFELDGASCDVNFVGTVDNMDIDGASTDISITNYASESNIQIDGASCKLELTLPKECGFLVRMDGLSCNFHSDLDYNKTGSTYAYGNRKCVVDVDGLSCDVTIQESSLWF